MGKPENFPSYGWDNEYGEWNVKWVSRVWETVHDLLELTVKEWSFHLYFTITVTPWKNWPISSLWLISFHEPDWKHPKDRQFLSLPELLMTAVYPIVSPCYGQKSISGLFSLKQSDSRTRHATTDICTDNSSLGSADDNKVILKHHAVLMLWTSQDFAHLDNQTTRPNILLPSSCYSSRNMWIVTVE